MIAPGGNLVAGSGGYLQLWNWANQVSLTAAPYPINYRWMDVAHWRFIQHRVAKALTYSGCFGATRRRLICTDWEIHARVWWDFARPPEIQLTTGDTLAVKLTIGAESTWQGSAYTRRNNFEGQPSPTNPAIISANGLGILPQGGTFLPCYCTPQGTLTLLASSDSSEGDEDGIVWQDIKIKGDSLLWYLSSQQDQGDYAIYLAKLANQGFIAYG